MADSDAVERALATARVAFVAPAPARARMRAGLQARGAWDSPPAAAPLAATGVAKSTVGVLVALALGAGYCLGRLHPGELSAPIGLTAPAVATLTPGDPSPSDPDLGVAASSSASSIGAARPASDGDLSRAPASEPAERSGAPRSRARVARGAPASSSAKVDRFAEELALLQRAEHALRAGEAELALSFVADLEQRYPQSSFSEERGAVRIMAECVCGRAGARGRAELFLSDRSASMYTDRVRHICELDSAAQAPGAAAQAPGGADGSRARGH